MKVSVLSSGHQLAESPGMNPWSQDLFWVDIEKSKLYTRSSAGDVSSVFVTNGITSAHPLSSTNYAFTGTTSIGILSGKASKLLWEGPIGDGWRFNDSLLLPSGELVVNTKSTRNEHTNQRLGILGKRGLDWKFSGLSLGNGIAWDQARKRLYVSDSKSHSILRWPTSKAGHPLTDASPSTLASNLVGEPDGMTLDCQGNLLVAEWGTGCLLEVSPDGAIRILLRLPTPYISSVAWADTAMKTLIITTAADSEVSIASKSKVSGGDVLLINPV